MGTRRGEPSRGALADNDARERRRFAGSRILPGLLAISAAVLSGCSGEIPGLSDVRIPVPHILRPEERIDRPSNVIERALSECPKRVEAAEADCVKKALIATGGTISDVVMTIGGCQRGRMCHYEYTTIDRVGYVQVTASNFVVRWRVDFDFTRPAPKIDLVPITVVRI